MDVYAIVSDGLTHGTFVCRNNMCAKVLLICFKALSGYMKTTMQRNRYCHSQTNGEITRDAKKWAMQCNGSCASGGGRQLKLFHLPIQANIRLRPKQAQEIRGDICFCNRSGFPI